MEKIEQESNNWSEKVEDLIESGEIDTAISLLETLIPKFETLSSHQSQLASVLLELSKLYSSKGLSLKSDEARSRATVINLKSLTTHSNSSSMDDVSASVASRGEYKNNVDSETSAEPQDDNVATKEDSDDDWEAVADRDPDELLSPQCLPEVSKLSLEHSESNVPKRRGRGNFTYRKHGLYSDQQADDSIPYDSTNEIVQDKSERNSEARRLYGTHHVLVLDGFHPSTTTMDLERLFEDFKERGFAIRWVNDTLALAVFRTPSVALEARNSVHCSFAVRVLEEDDLIMSSVSAKDLDPPRQRPKTSARTAQRLIAQELGVKMPSTFGSRELRKQEDDRRNRITTRQTLRDEAWGPDDVK